MNAKSFFVAVLFLTVFATSVSALECWSPNITSEAACLQNTSCTWMSDSWGSWCTEKGCWNFNTNQSCTAGSAILGESCNWRVPTQPVSWCEQRGCWHYRDTNESTCEQNEYALSCEWHENGDCVVYRGCPEHQTQGDCIGTGWGSKNCTWNDEQDYCYENNCNINNGDPTACAAMAGCVWEDPNCNEIGCWNYNTENNCETSGCHWKTSMQGWCERAQCYQYDNVSLAGAANENGCVNNPANLSCAWNGNGGWCYPALQMECSDITTERGCMDTFYCFWNFGNATCNEPGGMGSGPNFFEMKNPGCFIFDYSQAVCQNVTGCSWNAGTSKCEGLETAGVGCGNITNSTMCNSIPMLSKCCEWRGTTCEETFLTTCWDQMEQPPEGAMFCEDYNSYDNQQLCDQIAGPPWFMPCQWDAEEEQCHFKGDNFFGENQTGKLFEIDNKMACESAGGQWITESYCDGEIAVPAGRCEPKFDQMNNCDKACFACELQGNGSAHADGAAAETACEESKMGCQFVNDTTAPNGFGYCEVKGIFKSGAAGDCQNDCNGCTYLPNAQVMCDSSKAGCKWNSALNVCVDNTEYTCSDACDRCYDTASCVNYGRGAPGACTWSDESMLCQNANGQATEVCWNGDDDNDDGMVDCADSQCVADPACGATTGVNCFLYKNNESCFNATGCAWMSDSWGGWCDMKGAMCWQESGDQAGCAALNDSCSWWPAMGGASCELDWENIGEPCWAHMNNQTACEADTANNCTWTLDDKGGMGGFCDYLPIAQGDGCYEIRNNATCLANASCTWLQDGPDPQFGHCDIALMEHCRDLQSNLTACDADPMCRSLTGYCDPIGFGGQNTGEGGMNCPLFNGDEASCLEQTGCAYMVNQMGGGCDINRTCSQPLYANNQTLCEAAGCVHKAWTEQQPWVECYPEEESCFRNQTLQQNATACNESAACTWRQFNQGDPGHCEPDLFTNQDPGSCTGAGGIWVDGFCNDAKSVQSFQSMEMGAPVMLGVDDDDSAGGDETEIIGFGMKDMEKDFGFGAMVLDLSQSAICNGQYLENGQQGQGNQETKYFLYLDTDGSQTGNCAAHHDALQTGYEFFFSYGASSGESSVTETMIAYRCNGGAWAATDIKLSAFRSMMCQQIGGPMLAVDKGGLMRFPALYNPEEEMRVVVAIANGSGNRSSVSDYAGPGWYTPGAVDFELEDVFGQGVNTAKYEDVLRQGFNAYEDCYNDVDDDKDALIDCNDYDCAYAQVCANIGVNAPGFEDKLTPMIVGVKIEQYPDAALVMYDTNKPANGTLHFYGNDSTCAGNEVAIFDVGIQKRSTVREFKVWHSGHLNQETLGYALQAGTKYYFKLEICDDDDKCAKSKCSELKTAPANACKYCNFVTRIKAPAGWYVSYDADQDGSIEHVQGQVCGPQAGMSTNYTEGRLADIYLFDNLNRTASNASGIVFLNTTLTKSALNQKVRDVESAGAFRSGTQNNVPYAGLPRETRDKIVNSLHPEVCRVVFPAPAAGCAAAGLWHCDDAVTSCEERDDAVLISAANSLCEWQVPYCEFSVWAGGDATSTGGDGGDGGNGGGGGGGGGGGAPSSQYGNSYSWSMIQPGETVTATFPSGSIVSRVSLLFKKSATNVRVSMNSSSDKPTGILVEPPAGVIVYQYVSVPSQNVEGNANIEVSFAVPSSWLNDKGLLLDGMRLFWYDAEKHQWLLYPSIWTEDAKGFSVTSVKTAGLGNFLVGGMTTLGAADGDANQLSGQAIGGEELTGKVVDVPSATQGDGEAAAQAREEPAKQSYTFWLILVGIAGLVGIVAYMLSKKKE